MKDSPLYPVAFMVLLSALFAAAVSSIAVATRDRVDAGERARFRAHVLSALGIEAPEDPAALARVWQERIEERAGPEGPYYAARKGGAVTGYAFPFQGPGFWGAIAGILATDPAGTEIQGIAFTSHQETPGLGGRITEPWFRDQFRGAPLAPPERGGKTLDFVFREPRGPREVEAITGATQTSTRLEKFLNDFLADLFRRGVFGGGAG